MSSGGNLKRARRLAQSGLLDPRIRAALEAHDPTVFDARADWYTIADTHLDVFDRLGGRFPSDGDLDPEMRSSGKWWSNQRASDRDGTFPADRAAYLDDRCPGWRDPAFVNFVADADDHITLYHRLGRRLPTPRDADNELSMSGNWWSSRRRGERVGALDPARTAYLDERIPHWRDADHVNFLADADDHIALLRDRDGRYPSSRDPDPATARSGHWWHNRRTADRAGRLQPERAAYLDECCPGWRTGNR